MNQIWLFHKFDDIERGIVDCDNRGLRRSLTATIADCDDRGLRRSRTTTITDWDLACSLIFLISVKEFPKMCSYLQNWLNLPSTSDVTEARVDWFLFDLFVFLIGGGAWTSGGAWWSLSIELTLELATDAARLRTPVLAATPVLAFKNWVLCLCFAFTFDFDEVGGDLSTK